MAWPKWVVSFASGPLRVVNSKRRRRVVKSASDLFSQRFGKEEAHQNSSLRLCTHLLFDEFDILLGPGFLKNTALVARRSQGARRGKGERLDVGRYEERLESSFHSETCKSGHETTINQTAKESVMKKQEYGMSGDGVRQNDGGFKRRHLLLTSLVAASALLGAGVAIPAQAQQPASTPPNGKPPNILVIMTDDVWYLEYQCLSSRYDGRTHAQH